MAARATLAGAEGGCQAEVGAASAMAAAALPPQGRRAGAVRRCRRMALGNLLGLVCDPVAGLVEVPCVKRNVVGAVNAVSCANMALAGVDYAIPVMRSSTPWAAWAACSPRPPGRPVRVVLPPRPPASVSPRPSQSRADA
ncbi:MAG: L-serine ammonia-lyase, iron-sulfur-dependent, subunit beta [Faecalibacterium prausnitzii]